MGKELQINRAKLAIERDAGGSLKFFRSLPDGQKVEIRTSQEHLVDALHFTLNQLVNLTATLHNDYEPPPTYYLLRDLLNTAQFNIETLCDVIEGEFGRIEVYTCDDAVPGVMKNDFLGVSGPSHHVRA